MTLTLAHTALWLGEAAAVEEIHADTIVALTVIFTADLSEALSHPTSLECPSTRCSEYTLGLIITHLLLFTFVAQLLGFALIIYELQSAPRRVLADKTLSSILQKSTAQLLLLREEIRHARALGSTPSPYSPMSMLHSAPGAHPLARRTGSLGNLPSLGRYSVEDREESGRRRKMRTVSSSTSLEDTATWGREFPWGETPPRVIDLSVDGPDDTLVESFDTSHGEVIGKSDRPGKPRQVTFSDEPLSIIEPLTPSDRHTRDLRSTPLRRPSSTPVSASPEVGRDHAEGQNSLEFSKTCRKPCFEAAQRRTSGRRT